VNASSEGLKSSAIRVDEAGVSSIKQDPGRRFIGRHRELDAIKAALERAVSREPSIVLLAGEPGIGKTRTAQEISKHAGQCDVLGLWGRCSEEPGAPPYWPWLQLIRTYLAHHDEHSLDQAIGPAKEQLASLDPDLVGRLAEDIPESAETDAAKARFRLFDSIAGFWRRAAARQPLLLVIDDLHRADVPSLRLLEFVMAEAGTSRLLMLGTYRDAEVARQHPLSNTLAELHRHVRVQRLLLGGFSPAETAQFVAAATGTTSSELATMLHDQTEGHPLFLTELARDFQQANATTVSTAWAGLSGVPRGVRGVIGARLDRLTGLSLQVLQHAAVFGREFRLDLLRRVLGDPPEVDCLSAMEEARTASLIVEAGAPGCYQFVHALVREALYDELPAGRRAQVHQKIGAALELQFQDDLTPCLSALAHHYHAAGKSGDTAKAIEYATRAAERATTLQAHEEASRHYLRACAGLTPGAGTDVQRCVLLLGLGEAQNSAGASAMALATFAEAADCARRLSDPALLARAAIGFGQAQWRLGIEGSSAVVLIREALMRLAPADLRHRTALLTALCQALLFSNQPDEAETAFRKAVALARHLDDPVTLFRAMCAILPGRWFPDRLALRIQTAREAIELARRAGHPEWAAPYLSGWHTGDLMEAGDTVGATATAQFHLVAGEAMREPFNEAVALAALAMIATHEGRFSEAESLAARALRCGTRFDRANAAGIFGVQMFTIRRHQGRLRELAPILGHFLGKESQGTAWGPGLAILYCELGDRAEAYEVFERLAVGDFAGIARDAIRISSLAYLAEVCVWLGDTRRAAILFELLLPYSGRTIVFGAHTASFGAADRLLGMLAATLKRWDLAHYHYERAIGFDERTGGRPWLAHSRTAMANMLLQRKHGADYDQARSLLKAALDDARKLGMRGLEETILALQQQSEIEHDPACTLAGLSRREIEVLSLVAAGKTNQEIAVALFRSPNTVANHVRNILGKTQAANRAEAAAFAARHGLLPSK
jgi:DNA-binding CsgD family transcriptional regulator